MPDGWSRPARADQGRDGGKWLKQVLKLSWALEFALCVWKGWRRRVVVVECWVDGTAALRVSASYSTIHSVCALVLDELS